MSESQQSQAPVEESVREVAAAPAYVDSGPKMSREEFERILEESANAPAIAPEEYESWADWSRTAVLILVLTLLEVVCLFLYNTDFFPRLSAAFAGDFGRHFPGSAFVSLLLAVGTGALCAFGMLRRVKWLRAVSEMRILLGPGQVIVFLLLSELIISKEIWRIFPFFILLAVMVVAYISLGRTKKPFYQMK